MYSKGRSHGGESGHSVNNLKVELSGETGWRNESEGRVLAWVTWRRELPFTKMSEKQVWGKIRKSGSVLKFLPPSGHPRGAVEQAVGYTNMGDEGTLRLQGTADSWYLKLSDWWGGGPWACLLSIARGDELAAGTEKGQLGEVLGTRSIFCGLKCTDGWSHGAST